MRRNNPLPRDFDIIIYGATGFTGRLAAQYIMRSGVSKPLRIAIAGRNLQKLEEVQKSCELKPEILIADSSQPETINQMVQKTKVVLSFAGPFALYGEPVIAACVKFGTDYLDITGETSFIHNMIKRYQQQAVETGARLIPFSGFDSIPADLTVYLALDAARNHNFELDEMCCYYQIKGGFNGGTLASALNMAEKSDEKETFNSDILSSDKSFANKSSQIHLKPLFEKVLRRWTAPFFMDAINKAVVYRSSWLRSQLGENAPLFQYEERLVMSQRFGYLQAMLTAGMLVGFQLLSRNSLGRRLLRRLGPKPGEGPSDETRLNGFFRSQLICRSQGKCKIIVRMEKNGDPGNEITVALACESARLAAEKVFSTNIKGFITPATAFGMHLKKRLAEVGFQFNIELQ